MFIYGLLSGKGNIENTAVTSRDEGFTVHRSSVRILSLPSDINAPQRLHIGQGFMTQQSAETPLNNFTSFNGRVIMKCYR